MLVLSFSKPIQSFSLSKHLSALHRTIHIDKRVVVTGLGIVCPLGVGINHVWNKLIDGFSGISAITSPTYQDIPCKVAAFVPQGVNEGEFNSKKHFKDSDFKKFSLSTAYALVAAEEALDDAKWHPKTKEQQEYTGVALGTGMVDLMDIVDTGCTLKDKGYRQVSPFFVPRILNNMTAGHVAMKYAFKGVNHTVSTACATGLHAVGDAYTFIRNGHSKVMVCGSSEAVISPLSIAGFSRMRALATSFNDRPPEASRPFDRSREGFIMGEGAAVLVLESLEHATNRDANIYAEVVGYGLSGDAHHMTSPPEDGNGAYRSMRASLSQNGIRPSDIGYINAHATSTPVGDAAEVQAIHDLFGDHSRDLVVSSTKGATGHLLGAAGSMEAIFTVLSCHSNVIPPNLNLNNPDVHPHVNLASESKQSWPGCFVERYGLANSFGFGGTNASVVFVDSVKS